MITLVSGFGRCGSSLVMQMLEAAGLPMTGEYPAFEDMIATDLDASLDKWLRRDGAAVKLLDPQRHNGPRGIPCRVIWLDRDPTEQAKSQLKFGRLLGIPGWNSTSVAALAASYRKDRPEAVKRLSTWATEGMITMTFESIITQPDAAAEMLNAFLQTNCAHQMADIVRPRPVQALPDLGLELSLIAEREQLHA